MDANADLRALLETLTPHARDTLRRVLIHDQADCDAIASDLLCYRDERGDDWADIIDMLTMHPDARRNVVRLLGEIDSTGSSSYAHDQSFGVVGLHSCLLLDALFASTPQTRHRWRTCSGFVDDPGHPRAPKPGSGSRPIPTNRARAS